MPSLTSQVSAQSVAIDLLGGFEVRCGGEVVELPASAQRLVAFLAICGGPLRRLHVAGRLWMDISESRANAALRTALWRTRRPECPIVADRGGRLELAPAVDVDVHRTAAVVRAVMAGPPASAAALPDLDRLWTSGELLPDWYDDWVLVEREQHRQLRLHALESICGTLAEAGRFGEAVAAGLAAVANEPLRESAHRALIAVHLAEGNAAEALHHFDRFKRTLRDELGLEPSLRMVALLAGLHPRDAAVTTVR
jgi:DNA-binding SARP family transcriptional activator